MSLYLVLVGFGVGDAKRADFLGGGVSAKRGDFLRGCVRGGADLGLSLHVALALRPELTLWRFKAGARLDNGMIVAITRWIDCKKRI